MGDGEGVMHPLCIPNVHLMYTPSPLGVCTLNVHLMYTPFPLKKIGVADLADGALANLGRPSIGVARTTVSS